VSGDVDVKSAHARALVLDITTIKPNASVIGVTLSMASFLSKSASNVCEAIVDLFFQAD